MKWAAILLVVMVFLCTSVANALPGDTIVCGDVAIDRGYFINNPGTAARLINAALDAGSHGIYMVSQGAAQDILTGAKADINSLEVRVQEYITNTGDSVSRNELAKRLASISIKASPIMDVVKLLEVCIASVTLPEAEFYRIGTSEKIVPIHAESSVSAAVAGDSVIVYLLNSSKAVIGTIKLPAHSCPPDTYYVNPQEPDSGASHKENAKPETELSFDDPDGPLPEDEFLSMGRGIKIRCNKDVVYADKQGMWRYRLSLAPASDVPIRLSKIDVYCYTYRGKYIFEYEHKVYEMNRWWGSSLIKPGESRAYTSGLPSRNDIYFRDYVVEGIDENGNKVIGTYRVHFSKEVEKIPGDEFSYNNGPGEESIYDTFTLRHNADFKLAVAKGVYWVPANTLGKSDLTREDINGLGDDPEVLQREIDTLYEVIQYIQVADFSSASDNIRIREGEIDWEHHKPGELAILTNEGCCATISNLLNYLLQDDYEEVGFMAYSRSDGGGHVFNYIKHNGKYYIVDLTHYRNDFMNTAVEDGDYKGYYASDFIAGNIHEVEDLRDFAVFYRKYANKPPVLFSAYAAENVLPIDSVRRNGELLIVYPNTYKDKVTIVFDDPNDTARYEFIAPPIKYPEEWEPYNTKHVK